MLPGVVLRRLLSDPALDGVTHVVVDEVHERSADSDLLLLLLRDLLSAGTNPGLRVILMSATAEAGAFVPYFDAALGKVSAPLRPYAHVQLCSPLGTWTCSDAQCLLSQLQPLKPQRNVLGLGVDCHRPSESIIIRLRVL